MIYLKPRNQSTMTIFFIFLHVLVKGFFYKLFKNIIDTCRKFLLTAEQDRNRAGSVG